MLLSAVSVLVVAQSSSEVPEGLMNNPVYTYVNACVHCVFSVRSIINPCKETYRRSTNPPLRPPIQSVIHPSLPSVCLSLSSPSIL